MHKRFWFPYILANAWCFPGLFCVLWGFLFCLILRFPFKSWNLVSGSQISCLSLELMLQEILVSSTFSWELAIFPSLSFGAFMSAVVVCKSLWVVTATMKVKDTCSLEEKLWQTYCCSVLYLVAPSCPTLCDPMYCSPPGSSFYGDSPGKNTGVGGHAFLQGIFPTQGLNPRLPHCRWILYFQSHQGRLLCCQVSSWLMTVMTESSNHCSYTASKLQYFLDPPPDLV